MFLGKAGFQLVQVDLSHRRFLSPPLKATLSLRVDTAKANNVPKFHFIKVLFGKFFHIKVFFAVKDDNMSKKTGIEMASEIPFEEEALGRIEINLDDGVGFADHGVRKN